MRRENEQWCFEKMCYIVRNNFQNTICIDGNRIDKTQDDIVKLLYYFGKGERVFSQDRFDRLGLNDIFYDQQSLLNEYMNDIYDNEKDCLERIKYVFSTDIFRRNKLIKDLIDAALDIDNLYQGNNRDLLINDIDEQSWFFLRCLQSAAKYSNNFKHDELEKEKERLIMKYGLETGHSLQIDEKVSKSSAICIKVKGDDIEESSYNEESGVRVFHHFESALEFIMQEGFIILAIETTLKTIEVIVRKAGYKLSKLNKEQCQEVIELLKPYMETFKPKASWKGMNIAQLAENGFNKDIWIPYGYYDEDRLIAICDYKIRVDRDIEIGIMCVDEDYRGENLAKSLLFFFRLKFFALRLFSGTYNENSRMIKAFEGTGFQPLIFNEDAENVIKGTNIKYDRIDKKRYYSVYYIAEPLWEVKKNLVPFS